MKLVELPGYVQTTFFLVCEKSAMTSTLVDLQIKFRFLRLKYCEKFEMFLSIKEGGLREEGITYSSVVQSAITNF